MVTGCQATQFLLDELAAVAGTGKYQLVRRFKARTGIPPHSYQVALRVNLARRLLERGERATDVAALAGFVDQSHLTRHFRQRLGMTPARYANATSRASEHTVTKVATPTVVAICGGGEPFSLP